jgi:hypothetical protein
MEVEFKSCTTSCIACVMDRDRGDQVVFFTSSKHFVLCHDAQVDLQMEHSYSSASPSMHGAQTTSPLPPPADPIPTYEPNQPDSYYPSALNIFERIWHDRYHFLFQRGLQLRPRYRPGWTPSWLNTKGEFLLAEDSLEQPVRLFPDPLSPLTTMFT